MSRQKDFDDRFDATLVRRLSERLNASPANCPDPDLLAAYAAQSLGEDERTHWESHVAGCALCQSQLATLARAGILPEAAAPATTLAVAPPGSFAAGSFGDRPRADRHPAIDEAVVDKDNAVRPVERRLAADGLIVAVRRAFRFAIGPLPLSVALHVIILLFLLITVHEQRGRELIMVNLEAGGGGGGNNDEMQDLDMPEVPMPDTAPQQMDQPTAVDTSQSVGLANDYVRAAGGGGIGIGRGGGMGSGYGHGIGAGFGGFIGELRRKGLDIVLVVDGTGSMNLIIDDVKAKMVQLIRAVHRLVPIARVGIVVFGGKGEAREIQPLTLSPDKLQNFLGHISAKGGAEWEEDTLGAVEAGMNKMDWKPYAKKVIVLVGDSPPEKADFAPLLADIRKFKTMNGTFNTVDVSAEEHERFEREFWLKVHRQEPPSISPLPEFYQQTRQAYKVLASAGGGSMKSLTKDAHINQQVLILAFGDQWQNQVSAFGRGITSGQ